MIKQVVRGGPGKDENYREFIMTAAADASVFTESSANAEGAMESTSAAAKADEAIRLNPVCFTV